MDVNISLIILIFDVCLVVFVAKNELKIGTDKFIIAIVLLMFWIISNMILLVTNDVYVLDHTMQYKVIFDRVFMPIIALFVIEMVLERKVKMWGTIAITIIPLISIIMLIVPSLNKYVVLKDGVKGIIYIGFSKVSIYYSYILGIFCIFSFCKIFKKSSKKFKQKSIIVLILMIIAVVYNFFVVNKIFSVGFDVTPLIISISLAAAYFVFSSVTYITLKTDIEESVVSKIENIIISYDNAGFVIYVNEALLSVFNLERNKILGLNVFDRNSMNAYFPSEVFFIINGKFQNIKFSYKNKQYKNTVSNVNLKKKIVGKMVQLIDITEETEYNEKLHIISNTDALTGLRNRYAYENDDISFENKNNVVFAVLYVDLDNLKITNDILGHESGDLVIKEFSRIFKEVFKDNSLGLYRIGGDEFCAILCDVSEEKIKMSVDELYTKTVNKKGSELYKIRFSSGCAFAKELLKSLDDLYKFSDLCMYRSKQEGKGRCTFFTEEIYNQYVMQNKLDEDFIRGIKEGEIVAFFQPKYNIKDKVVDSAEALVRWNHKTKGIIYPGEFLDLAYNLKLIGEIDFIVFEKSCEKIKEWQVKYNKTIKVSVNLSLESLIKPTLIDDIKRIISKYEVDPKCITFEVLENKAINDFVGIHKIISTLKEFGVKFAIDDFGSGVSNFDMLDKLDVDCIKIDKSLIDHIATSEKHRNNLKLICSILRSFKCEIVAEGVEDKEQSDILEDEKIDYIQGYYYGKPIALDDFEKRFVL